jgi:hypothetical protein
VSGARTEDVIRNSFADQWFERLVSDIESNETLDKKPRRSRSKHCAIFTST